MDRWIGWVGRERSVIGWGFFYVGRFNFFLLRAVDWLVDWLIG